MRANETYSEAKRQFSDRNKYAFISGGPRTLKSVVFGSSSSLHRLVGGSCGPACESVGKGDLLSYHIDSKLSRETVDHRSLAVRVS